MHRNFDSIDIFFITLISIYLMSLLLFFIVYLEREIDKSKLSTEEIKPKALNKIKTIKIPKKKVIKKTPNNLIKNNYYKNYISYPKNNPN